jgi:uncharacterized protein YutE (UPF0331/DUF86 family)
MDRSIFDRKFESLRKCLLRVQSKVPATAEELDKDIDLQDIVSVNLERSVQLSVDIASQVLAHLESPVPDTLASSFDALANESVLSKELAERMRKAVGFRNIVVHEYNRVDWKIVHSLATKNIYDFKEFIKSIDHWIEKSIQKS